MGLVLSSGERGKAVLRRGRSGGSVTRGPIAIGRHKSSPWPWVEVTETASECKSSRHELQRAGRGLMEEQH